MPGLELTLSMPGLQPLTVGLTRLRMDISDWQPFWQQTFIPFFYRWVLQDFVNEGAQSGDRWAALSPEYATWKALHFPGRGILVRSGVLKASLTQTDDPHAVVHMTPTGLEIGSDVPYGIFHQVGTTRMPQRPPMRVSETFMRTVGKG